MNNRCVKKNRTTGKHKASPRHKAARKAVLVDGRENCGNPVAGDEK
jgi:hypothetical protein